ncbi:MAG: hypothetical protein Q7S58_21410 [Candidatus Binatus sp.]|uniref:hypothetical protein n=1 Tax=Candidatus Binatus sp. TaxID=2811406 RepID=UPI0027279953|nr:hypothetical protein [Candidatus Binatus sp.]MDO8434965.1 hypothetical protein [Candidatus Binatus sp.]
MEKDEVLSIIRLVDTFYVHVPKELPEAANPVVQLTALLSFKRGDEPDTDKHQVKLKIQPPTGSAADLPIVMDFVFKPGDIASANLIMNIQLGIKTFGRFRLDVFVDDQGPVAEIPFMLLEQPEQKTPERVH